MHIILNDNDNDQISDNFFGDMMSNIEILHESIYKLLMREAQTNELSYQNFANAKGRPYQSYERIEFKGLRWSVEKRIKEYGLSRFFNSKSRVLDIGSNYGFFVNEFALHCKEAHGVEPTEELNKIGTITAEYLGIADKVKFFTETFEDYEPDNNYDTIMSLAAFFTSDVRQRGSAEAYFGKVHRLLNSGGWLFYESTSYQKEPGDEDFSHYAPSREALSVIEELYDEVEHWEAPSGPDNLRLYVCGKKS